MLGHMIDNSWTVDRIPDQSGRTVIVTGANSGLGLVTTRQLARRGAHVIMAVRNEAKGRQALAGLAGEQPGARLELRRLDLADLDSVRRFADALHADGIRVDVLVNNAGIMMPPRSLSAQGHESQFASNHLGHFALTGLVLDLLEAGTDPRVVTVSSGLHRRGSIHFDDLTGAKDYSPTAFYAQSKFANVLFGLELHRRLTATGSPVRSLLAHPGYAATNLQTKGPKLERRKAAELFMRTGNRFFAQSAESGALPILYAATAPGVEPDSFTGPSFANWRGSPARSRRAKWTLNDTAGERLWAESERLTGVTYDALKV
jgi:NAD(P)-dependent dehydrogenase (short-subunit alcohol dehydrogenase family)